MGNIKFDNSKFFFVTDNETKLLFDANNVMQNKSRVPMFFRDATKTMQYLLIDLRKKYLNLFEEGVAPSDADDLLLIDILLVAKLSTTSSPIKVAELGCANGRLSYHLANIISSFNETSTLCCISDFIGNASGNHWLDMISLVKCLPKLSFIASDYNDTNLQNNSFDIVIINGSVQMNESNSIIKEAQRILKPNGTLICYAWKQPHIANSMKEAFISLEQYQMDSDISILVAHPIDAVHATDEFAVWQEDVKNDFLLAEIALQSETNKTELFELTKKLNHHADYATTNNIVDIKLKSLYLKEQLLIKYIEL